MKEIRALTGLRGVAALIVFFAHTRETLETRGLAVHVPQLLERLFLSGGRQVDIFFVLSGFILTMIYRDQFATSVTGGSWASFLQRRVARVWPLHLFMLLLVLVFVTAARLTGAHTVHGLDGYTLSTLPAHVLMVHAWGFLGPAVRRLESTLLVYQHRVSRLSAVPAVHTGPWRARRKGMHLQCSLRLRLAASF